MNLIWKGQPVVIAGDLNDSSRWDHDYPDPLEKIFDGFRHKHNIVSLYHKLYCQVVRFDRNQP